ncbi:MAG: trimeric intracellular cation channel family protein [Sneathiella sp.]
MELSHIISILDLVGVAVFAASGSLVASRKEMDIVGFGLMAALTGIGGGTLRDLLLDRPVFWIADQSYLLVCFFIAVMVFFFAHRLQKRYVALLWADAVGLSAFGVMGAHIASVSEASPLAAIAFGVMTATFGGLARDIAAGENPLLLKPEVYVTAALLAAGTYVGLALVGVMPAISAVIGILAGFLLRAGGIHFGWVLPRYKSRAGRDY